MHLDPTSSMFALPDRTVRFMRQLDYKITAVSSLKWSTDTVDSLSLTKYCQGIDSFIPESQSITSRL